MNNQYSNNITNAKHQKTYEKKVCFIVKDFPLPSETFIAEEALSLYDFDIEPHILSLNNPGSKIIHKSAQVLLDSGNVTYIKPQSKIQSILGLLKLFFTSPISALKGLNLALHNKERWRYFQMIPYAYRIKTNKINRLHAHFADENLIAAEVISHWTGIPYGVTTHGYDLRDLPITKKCLRKLANNCNCVITISKFNKQFMSNEIQVLPENINIIHCGIRLSYFSAPNREERSNGTLNLITTGRLAPVKNQASLLRALRVILDNNIDIKLKIIGDGPLLSELKYLAEELKISASVTFLGVQSQDQVINELKLADIFVMPSLSEGIPVACMEAMAMKLPVIASDITGMKELIEHGTNGLLTKANDHDSIADAVIQLAKNPAKRIMMGENALIKVKDEFERHNNTRKLLTLWNML